MNFIRFHAVSFGRVLDPRLLLKAMKDLSAILDLGSHPNEFIRFHSGEVLDSRLPGITSSNFGSSWTSKVPKVMAQDPTTRVYRPYVIPCFRLYCLILPGPSFLGRGVFEFISNSEHKSMKPCALRTNPNPVFDQKQQEEKAKQI